MSEKLLEEFRKDRLRNLEDVVRHARWEAEMVRKLAGNGSRLGIEWLWEALESDQKLWRDPRIKEALIKAILVGDRWR